MANVITLPQNPIGSLTADDWDTIAALPVDRPLSVEDLARQLQVSRATASRKVMRLRRLAVLREIAVIDIDRALGLARSILRGSLVSSREAFADFSDAVRNDPCVVEASILSGRQDFEITTLHSDERAAIEYADDFKRRAFVRACERQRLSVLFRRPMTNGASLRPTSPSPSSRSKRVGRRPPSPRQT